MTHRQKIGPALPSITGGRTPPSQVLSTQGTEANGSGSGRGGVLPGTSASASSGCPGRWWPRGPRWRSWWAPIPGQWALACAPWISAALPAASSPGSPRWASSWPDACCRLGPLWVERDTEQMLSRQLADWGGAWEAQRGSPRVLSPSGQTATG